MDGIKASMKADALTEAKSASRDGSLGKAGAAITYAILYLAEVIENSVKDIVGAIQK